MPLSLKESFRYQNVLDTLFNEMRIYLITSPVGKTVTENHMRSAVNAEAVDEIKDATLEPRFPYSVDTLVDFMAAVVEEKRKLSLAIDRAKRASICIDAETNSNRMLRTMASVLNTLGKVKPSERITRGTAFKFNAEGNQVAYYYDIKESTTLDYDPAEMRRLSRITMARADETSAEIDKAMIEVLVEHEPIFAMSDSVDDAVESFMVACDTKQQQAS